MNKKKLNGYISVLLLIIITLISIGITTISLSSFQTTTIIKNNLYKVQSKYIAESYLKFYTKNFIEKDLVEENHLFEDLDHRVKYTIDEVKFNNIPSKKIYVESDYEKVNSNASCIISKYNKIFFIRESTITEEKLKGTYKDSFNKFKEKSKSELFDKEFEIVDISPGNVIISKDGTSTLCEIIDGKPLELKDLKNHYNYRIENFLEIGLKDENNPNVTINGNIYLKDTINLNCNLVINGIVISDSGRIVTNGHSCKINGVLIEIGQGGSFPNIEISYIIDKINLNIKRLKSAHEKEVLSVKINSYN